MMRLCRDLIVGLIFCYLWLVARCTCGCWQMAVASATVGRGGGDGGGFGNHHTTPACSCCCCCCSLWS